MFIQHSKIGLRFDPPNQGGFRTWWAVSDSPPPRGCRGSRPSSARGRRQRGGCPLRPQARPLLTREPRGSLGRTGGTLPAAKRLCIYTICCTELMGIQYYFLQQQKKEMCWNVVLWNVVLRRCNVGWGEFVDPLSTEGGVKVDSDLYCGFNLDGKTPGSRMHV